ncbi:hypothetical protein BDR04DRAFT_164070 [Suillus decipiens]|nr:hypothetical protein BDR04DRAFT_164070 [Suillus decipiens]
MLVVHPSSRCDICLDPYSTSSDVATSPHAIECGHIFCFGCLHSLNTSTCPLCREFFDSDRVKKLHVGNPLERGNAERNNTEQDNTEHGVVRSHADVLLRRMSLVSGEGVPDVDVVEVVSEVQEWLQSRPDDTNSVSPFHSASASQTRCIPMLVVSCYRISYDVFSIHHFKLP